MNLSKTDLLGQTVSYMKNGLEFDGLVTGAVQDEPAVVIDGLNKISVADITLVR